MSHSLVGEIVLLQVDKDVFRPLVVVRHEGTKISGEAYFDYTTDWSENMRRFLREKPWQGGRSQWVAHIEKGEGLWQWRRREQEPANSKPLPTPAPAAHARRAK